MGFWSAETRGGETLHQSNCQPLCKYLISKKDNIYLGSKEMIFTSEDSAPYGYIFVTSLGQGFKLVKKITRSRGVSFDSMPNYTRHTVAEQIDLVDSNE